MRRGLGLFLLLLGLGGLYYFATVEPAFAQVSWDFKWQLGGEEIQNPFLQMVALIGGAIALGSLIVGIGFLFLTVGSFVAFTLFFISCLIGMALLGIALPFLLPLFVPILMILLILLIKKKKSEHPSRR